MEVARYGKMRKSYFKRPQVKRAARMGRYGVGEQARKAFRQADRRNIKHRYAMLAKPALNHFRMALLQCPLLGATPIPTSLFSLSHWSRMT